MMFFSSKNIGQSFDFHPGTLKLSGRSILYSCDVSIEYSLSGDQLVAKSSGSCRFGPKKSNLESEVILEKDESGYKFIGANYSIPSFKIKDVLKSPDTEQLVKRNQDKFDLHRLGFIEPVFLINFIFFNFDSFTHASELILLLGGKFRELTLKKSRSDLVVISTKGLQIEIRKSLNTLEIYIPKFRVKLLVSG